LTREGVPEPVVIAIEIDDPVLLDRLTALLADARGFRLARTGERADAVLVSSLAVASAYEQGAGLTPREIQVLNLMAEGASNKTIARRLEISVHTVKFHVGSLLDKLDAAGRTDAVAHAARLGVINL
jgi:DNA-binding CsgD family transcriptional regulator